MKNMFGGRGSMGGGGGRGGMLRSLRSVGKAVSATKVVGVPQDPFPYCSTSSSPTLSHKNMTSNPISSSSTLFLYTKKQPRWGDTEWECVHRAEIDVASVPSETEVDDAVSALQHVLGPASGDQVTETDWAEPSFSSYNSTALQNQTDGLDRVYYAIHLLRTDPYVQRMVRSLSADKVVWDAVLKNEVVRELREAISAGAGAGEEDDPASPDETSNSESFVMRIFYTAKTIFMEVIEKITKIVNDLFPPATHVDAEGLDSFYDKLRASFILSIMVLMLVVLNRAQARAT